MLDSEQQKGLGQQCSVLSVVMKDHVTENSLQLTLLLVQKAVLSSEIAQNSCSSSELRILHFLSLPVKRNMKGDREPKFYVGIRSC